MSGCPRDALDAVDDLLDIANAFTFARRDLALAAEDELVPPPEPIAALENVHRRLGEVVAELKEMRR